MAVDLGNTTQHIKFPIRYCKRQEDSGSYIDLVKDELTFFATQNF